MNDIALGVLKCDALSVAILDIMQDFSFDGGDHVVDLVYVLQDEIRMVETAMGIREFGYEVKDSERPAEKVVKTQDGLCKVKTVVTSEGDCN